MAINKVINKSTKTHGAMRNVIEYVLQDNKIKEGYVSITGPYIPDKIDWDSVYKSFLEEKKFWDKDSGRMYAHNIISFHKDEDITPALALEIGQEFVEKFFHDHQSLICVHQDKDHLHVHIVTNTVSFIDGRKLQQSKRDLEKQKEFTNNLCLERGLSLTEKGKHFDGTEIEEGHITSWSKDKYKLFQHDDKKSFVADCAISVLKAKENCCSKEEFEEKMHEFGWSTSWTENRKHITFEDLAGNKVRDSNLSKTFNLDIGKEVLEREFERQNELRKERIRASEERELSEQHELDKYSAEVESALQGNGNTRETVSSIEAGDGREGQTSNGRETSGSGQDTKAFIRELKSQIRDVESENRAVKHSEDQSRFAAEQRYAAERERHDALERADDFER